ncbi:MAG TPA: 3,4-dioxygenase subunit beta, partial [Actinomycetota bacterium]|nr:3,4-dioxygenase subunit beta [Actinomycetota bacterium]
MTTRSRRPSTDSGRWLDEHGNEIEESDRGLVYDLRTLVDRRRVLGLFGGVGAATLLAACGGGSGTSGQGPAATATTAAPGSTTTAAGSASAGGDISEVPDETGGPFPGDGSNGPDVLDDSGVVR